MDERGYWSRIQRRAITRRGLLASAAGGAGMAALACAPRGSGGSATSGGAQPSAAGSNETPKPGGTFTTSNRDNSPGLDVHVNTSGYIKAPSSAILSRLLRYKTGTDFHVGENHETEPDLALSAESPDAITWTVKLRPDAKFHNAPPVSGHAVEAEDIKATITRALNPKNPARSGLDMIDPSQVQTPDKTTLVFKLKYPYAPFTSALASPNYFFIFPREALAGSYDADKQIIGSGPFTFESYTPDVGFVLKKNAAYFQPGQPYVDEIRWNVIPDIHQLEAQFTGGHIDILGAADGITLPINDIPSIVKDNPKAQVVKSDPAGGSVIFYRLGDPASAFQDVRVRRAVSMAVDRDALGKAIYNGDAEPQFEVVLSLGKKALHMSDLPAEVAKYYKYDPAQVKQLLQAAGMTDRQFKLVYFSGFLGPVYEQVAQTLANMMSTAGFKITAVQLDYQKDYIGGGKGIRYGNFDKDTIVYTGLSQYDEPDEYMFNYFSSKTTAGIARLNDPDFDTMIAKARAIVNDEERTKAYVDLQRYVSDKNYCLGGLPSPHVYTIVQPRIRNFQKTGAFYGLGTESFSKLWIGG
jgi:peptide/nickel transport system substrate-binding protein